MLWYQRDTRFTLLQPGNVLASQWSLDMPHGGRPHPYWRQPDYPVVDAQTFLLVIKYFYNAMIVVVMHYLLQFG
jgi:hypothetical protein